jgi:hypothetical protein
VFPLKENVFISCMRTYIAPLTSVEILLCSALASKILVVKLIFLARKIKQFHFILYLLEQTRLRLVAIKRSIKQFSKIENIETSSSKRSCGHCNSRLRSSQWSPQPSNHSSLWRDWYNKRCTVLHIELMKRDGRFRASKSLFLTTSNNKLSLGRLGSASSPLYKYCIIAWCLSESSSRHIF